MLSNYQILIGLLVVIAILHLLQRKKKASNLLDAIQALKEDAFETNVDPALIGGWNKELPQHHIVSPGMSIKYWHSDHDGKRHEIVDFIMAECSGGYIIHYIDGEAVHLIHDGMPNFFPIDGERQEQCHHILALTHQHIRNLSKGDAS